MCPSTPSSPFVQILSQANQSQSQQHAPPSSASSSSSSSLNPPPPSLAPTSAPNPAQFLLHGSLPLGCTKTPPSHLHAGLSLGGGCAQTPPLPAGLSGAMGNSGDMGWDSESKDPDKVKLLLLSGLLTSCTKSRWPI